MTSQNDGKLKSIAAIVTLLSAIAGLVTALVGQDGLSSLMNPTQGQDSSTPMATPSVELASESQDVHVTGDGNITIGGSNASTGPIQQAGDGNCNNIQASGESVTIICSPSSSGMSPIGFGTVNFPQGNRTASAPVTLQASVEGLERGGDRFTVWLTNATSDQSIDIPTTHLSISDDQGSTYELDPWTAREIGLSKVVPPNSRIQLDYTLTNPIEPTANSVTLTLDHVWAQPSGGQFKTPLPSIQWTTQL